MNQLTFHASPESLCRYMYSLFIFRLIIAPSPVFPYFHNSFLDMVADLTKVALDTLLLLAILGNLWAVPRDVFT